MKRTRGGKFGQYLTKGATELDRWLLRESVAVPEFCEKHRLSRLHVQRAMNGSLQKISVGFAESIEKATRGEVRIAWWSSTTIKPHRRVA